MNKPSQAAGRTQAFTLFEVMIALAVFSLAALGLAEALKVSIDAAISARERVLIRAELDSRLAYCMADPPRPGRKREIESRLAGKFQIEETLAPYSATNREGKMLKDLYRLTIVAKPKRASEGDTETVSVVMYHSRPFQGGPP